MKSIKFNSYIKKILLLLGGTDYDIFISYKRNEGDYYASALADFLSKNEFRCYFDQHVRDEGQIDLPLSLKKAVRNSTMLIILGTNQVEQSKWVKKEIDSYLERSKKNIIPINFGNAHNQDWFDLVKNFHSPNESIKNLQTGRPSTLILETVTNSFSFRKRNENLQRKAVFIILAIFFAILMTFFITRKIVKNAKNEMQLAVNEKNKAINDEKKARDDAKENKIKADLFRNQAESAKHDVLEATKQKNVILKEKTSLEGLNAQVTRELKETVNKKNKAEVAEQTALKEEALALERFRYADSLSKLQENIAQANLFASTALQQLDVDPTIAFNNARKAFSLYNNKTTLNTLYKCYISQYHYSNTENIKGLSFVRWLSKDMIVSFNGLSFSYYKFMDNKLELIDSINDIRLLASNKFYTCFDRVSNTIATYNPFNSTICIVTNKIVVVRKLPKNIGRSGYYDFAMEKMIDSSKIVFVDSARSSIIIFDWRQNKILSTLNITHNQRSSIGEIGSLFVYTPKIIMFSMPDYSTSEGTIENKIYTWKWESERKSVVSSITNTGLAITAIDKFMVLKKEYLCVANNDGVIDVWYNKQKTYSIKVHDGSIKKMAFFRDTLITIGSDNNVVLLKTTYDGKFEKIGILKGHKDHLFDFDYNPANGFLISNDLNFNSPAKYWRLNRKNYLLDIGNLDFINTNFFYDSIDIVEESVKGSPFFNLKHISASAPISFINKIDFASVNLNSQKNLLIACLRDRNQIYIFNLKGEIIDSLPKEEKKRDGYNKQQFLCADFIYNDSLIACVSKIEKSFRSGIQGNSESYIVLIYNRSWELVASFNPILDGLDTKVFILNDYLYCSDYYGYIKIPISPNLINNDF